MHIHSLVIVESSQIDRALISKKIKSISRLKVCVRAQEQGVSKTAEHAMVGGSSFRFFSVVIFNLWEESAGNLQSVTAVWILWSNCWVLAVSASFHFLLFLSMPDVHVSISADKFIPI